MNAGLAGIISGAINKGAPKNGKTNRPIPLEMQSYDTVKSGMQLNMPNGDNFDNDHGELVLLNYHKESWPLVCQLCVLII